MTLPSFQSPPDTRTCAHCGEKVPLTGHPMLPPDAHLEKLMDAVILEARKDVANDFTRSSHYTLDAKAALREYLSERTLTQSGTIKATAVPGTLPDTAPFVWDDPPAELTEALDECETRVRNLEKVALDWQMGETETWVMEEAQKDVTAQRAKFSAMYNRQREEIERLRSGK